jgi:hypothetical protein
MTESERVRSTVHYCTDINPDNSDNSDNPGRTDNFIVKFCLTLSQTLQFLCRVRAFLRRFKNKSVKSTKIAHFLCSKNGTSE